MWCFMWCRWNIGGTNQHLRWQTGQILVRSKDLSLLRKLYYYTLIYDDVNGSTLAILEGTEMKTIAELLQDHCMAIQLDMCMV